MPEESRGFARPPVAALVPARRADVDWLRVLGIVAVFAVHVAQVYSPWEIWHIQNPVRSPTLGEIAVLVWPWVMPLFMLLAGSGTYYSLGHRSNGGYLKERTVRILVPLLVGTVVLIPPQIYVERLSQGRFHGSYLEFYPRFFHGFYPHGNLSAGHLWFLGYLFAYAVLSLPLLRWVRDGSGRKWMQRLVGFCRRPGGLLWLGVPAGLSQLVLRAPFPQTLDFVHDWAHHAWLLSAFFLGFVLVSSEEVQEALDEQWSVAVIPAVVASVGLAFYAWTTSRPGVMPSTYGVFYFAFWTDFGVAGWCWLLVLVGAGRRYIRRRSRLLEYASTCVYPFYVFHQTVIVVLAWFVVRAGLGIGAGFSLLFVASFAVTMGLTEGARRLPAAGRLFGYRRPKGR